MRRNFPQTSNIILKDDSLSHFGVKGMRWGVVKKEESEGVRSAKSKLAELDKNVKDAHKQVIRESAYGFKVSSKKSRDALADALFKQQYGREDLDNAKILDKVNSRPKSKAQLKKEEEYKKLGMTDKEAAVAAYKNIQTKKTLMLIGGVALTAAVAYGSYKLYDHKVDKLIKAGDVMKNITTDGYAPLHDAFYSSTNRADHAKYAGMLGQAMGGMDARPANSVYQREIKALSDIRQASPANAQKIFAAMVNDDQEFKKNFLTHLRANSLEGVYASKEREAIKTLLYNKPVDRNTYEVFNAYLVDHREGMQKVTDQYFKKMSEAGYNAIRDVNDNKYSGYNTINPIIVFGHTGKVEVADVKKLTQGQVAGNFGKSLLMLQGEAAVKQGATVAGAIIAAKGALRLSNQSRVNKAVTKYRQENPGTKLTNTEIERMLQQKKQ